MNCNWEAGVGPSADALLEACNAALDECSPLTYHDVRMIASAMKDYITGEQRHRADIGIEDPYTACQRQLHEATALVGALETENAQHVNLIEILNQQRDELVLALMWCKMRLRHERYQQHVDWVLSKYPKPALVEEPRIVRSIDPDDDFCPSDPRGPGRTGGE